MTTATLCIQLSDIFFNETELHIRASLILVLFIRSHSIQFTQFEMLFSHLVKHFKPRLWYGVLDNKFVSGLLGSQLIYRGHILCNS